MSGEPLQQLQQVTQALGRTLRRWIRGSKDHILEKSHTINSRLTNLSKCVEEIQALSKSSRMTWGMLTSHCSESRKRRHDLEFDESEYLGELFDIIVDEISILRDMADQFGEVERLARNLKNNEEDEIWQLVLELRDLGILRIAQREPDGIVLNPFHPYDRKNLERQVEIVDDLIDAASNFSKTSSPGHLGLILDYEKRTVSREGYPPHTTVQLSNVLWSTFLVFFEAGTKDASIEEWKRRYHGDSNPTVEARSRTKYLLKEALKVLGITIPNRKRHLKSMIERDRNITST